MKLFLILWDSQFTQDIETETESETAADWNSFHVCTHM